MKKMNNYKPIKWVFIACVTIIFFIILLKIIEKNKERTIETAGSLNDEKICWGIKKNNNHNQPELGTTNKKLIEQYNGMAIGNKDSKNIYLTFDCGYEAGYTGKILDSLKEKNVKAAFFITAHYLNSAPDLVKRMIDEGHIVGNQFPLKLMYHI